jgi:hypothetical protein
MKEQNGDIWTWYKEKRWIVITTNIGYNKVGDAIMGAGIAKKAAELHDDLAGWYGARCRKYQADTAVCLYEPGNLILFPTKPFNRSTPWLSWQSKSCPELIARSARQLAVVADIMEKRKLLFGEIALPLVGCENGKLERHEVVPILREYLDDRFVLVERE